MPSENIQRSLEVVERLSSQLTGEWVRYGISQSDLNNFIAIQDRMKKKMEKTMDNHRKIQERNKKP